MRARRRYPRSEFGHEAAAYRSDDGRGGGHIEPRRRGYPGGHVHDDGARYYSDDARAGRVAEPYEDERRFSQASTQQRYLDPKSATRGAR